MNKLKEYTKLVRPLDIVIVVFLLIGSFVPYYIFSKQQIAMDETSEVVAVISINGSEVKRVTLSEDTPHEEFTLHPAGKQYNIIEVKGKKIRNKEDNSPDQIAVKTGWISKPGETSICLPHKLIIEIKAVSPTKDSENDVIIPL
ncbi:NusG domain II-containing protein [Carnobacterium mobile]|uniref:NusG domain II-containing protein n=1 Tax=Carnobacterium mobile TaxID=2750 RepID=UPI000557CFAC|nr:NusG domain II-containing protein [Carnobacterium mobile]